VRFGAHLPLIDFNGHGWKPGDLTSYVDAARDLGYDALCANDHFVFQRPWLDGIVALASAIDRSGSMALLTTVALPVVRGPVGLAKAAAAIDLLSGGRLILGVGPGSSARDHEAVGLAFEERWRRLDEAVRVLRAHLTDGAPAFEGRFYTSDAKLEPSPVRPEGPPIWIGSWGSEAGLRRVARLADGWLASAYNTTPEKLRLAREQLGVQLAAQGKDARSFPCALATMWTYVTEDGARAESELDALSRMLNRSPAELGSQVLIGGAEDCAAKIRAYAAAGVSDLFIWPLADEPKQLEVFANQVKPILIG
jgi:alkanesulfonate monooxygenase SsuD/methylene tetrahydromethanopterin reductase-like flavin-dependent oxidoreductase (luciferase family)